MRARSPLQAKMKKDTLKARAQSAKSARAINDMVGPGRTCATGLRRRTRGCCAAALRALLSVPCRCLLRLCEGIRALRLNPCALWLFTCTVVIIVGAAVHQRALQHAFRMHSGRVDACFNAARHWSLQVAGLDTSSALGAFERMEEKVMSLEAQAEAAQMVSRRCCSAAGPDSGRAAGLVDVQPLCARASLRCRSVDYAIVLHRSSALSTTQLGTYAGQLSSGSHFCWHRKACSPPPLLA